MLVADIGMPDQDGYSLIRAIRSLPPSAGGATPAVAVTAYASLREREAVLDAGYNWHLAKPVEPEQLVATVSTALGTRSTDSSGASRPRKNPRRRAKANGSGRAPEAAGTD